MHPAQIYDNNTIALYYPVKNNLILAKIIVKGVSMNLERGYWMKNIRGYNQLFFFVNAFFSVNNKS